jgi:glutaredoxin
MRILDLVFKAVETTENLMARARKTPRRKLAKVPEPPPSPDPFVARPAATTAPEPPLGDPERPAQVYGKRGCMWSGRVVRLIQDRGVEHQFVDLEQGENVLIEPRLVRETKQDGAPWVFLRGEFVGGYNALSEIDRLGQLELRTMTSEERERAEQGRTRIVIPKRGPEGAPPGERS